MVEEELDGSGVMLDAETEQLFRKIIHDYCDVLMNAHGKRRQEYEAFGRGMIQGAINILTEQGYGDWCQSALQEEFANYERELASQGGMAGFFGSKGFAAKTRRIVIPGNRFESGVNQ